MSLKNGLLILFFATSFSFAQTSLDSVQQLQEVIVASPRLKNFAIGSTVQPLEKHQISLFQSMSISELLSAQSSVIMTNYGIGGMSNPSIRGGKGSHTATIWNGLSIQSPMNGSLNFSTLPSGMLGNVSVQYGGSGTLFGSGAMTGAIHIETENILSQANNLEFSTGLGSFGNYQALGAVKVGNQTIASQTKVLYHTAENDFEFYNPAKLLREKQTNAGVEQIGLMQENILKVSDYSRLKTAIWFQHFDKDLQTKMIDYNQSVANQLDENLRISANYQHSGEKYSFNYKSGLLNDKIFYTNPNDISVKKSLNHSISLINEGEAKIEFAQNQIFNVGVNYTFEKAYSDGYKDSPQRHRQSIFASYKVSDNSQRINVVGSIRDEMADGKIFPVVYSLGTEAKVVQHYKLFANISKNYRIPTFNDLYWREDGFAKGNPDLKPESGWSGEAGIKRGLDIAKFKGELSQSFYYTSINNWISWGQYSSPKYMPENKDKGETKGFETRLNSAYTSGVSAISFNAYYTYTYARFYRTKESNTVAEKMEYIPENRWMLSLAYRYKYLSLLYFHNYSGFRPYDYQNSLKPYKTGDLFISHQIQYQESLFTLALKVLNLWDASYQGIVWYAMPGRNFQLSVTWNYKYSKNQ